jgi:cytochrome c peroxidase
MLLTQFHAERSIFVPAGDALALAHVGGNFRLRAVPFDGQIHLRIQVWFGRDMSWKEAAMARLLVLVFSILCFASVALCADTDQALREQANNLLGPLPAAMVSEKNPITPEKVALGKMLFYENRISPDGTVSCVRCHPMSLYAADGLEKSVGDSCKTVPRNAPTVLNAASQIAEHWLGNRADVEDQAKEAVAVRVAPGKPSIDVVAEQLGKIKGYAPLFEKAFPGDPGPVNIDNYALAVGAFERTLVTPSAFDSFLTGNDAALGSEQKRGLGTFMKTGCSGCHSSAYVGGQSYAKFGVVEPYWNYTESKNVDEGRYAITKKESDKYVFKVPVLRNVEMTSPYFHDGSVDSLRKAVWIMGKIQLGQDLGETEDGEIVDFLNALTGPMTGDAIDVPVLPPSH